MNLNASPSRCIFSISGAGLLEAIGIQSSHWAKLLPRFCAPDSSRSPWCGRWDGDIWTVLLLSCQTWGMPSMLGLHLASASVRLQVRLGHCVRTPRPEHRPSQDNSHVFLLSTASFDARLCEPFPVQSVRFHALRWAGTSSQPRGTWRQIKGQDIGPSFLESLTSKRASPQFLILDCFTSVQVKLQTLNIDCHCYCWRHAESVAVLVQWRSLLHSPLLTSAYFRVHNRTSDDSDAARWLGMWPPRNLTSGVQLEKHDPKSRAYVSKRCLLSFLWIDMDRRRGPFTTEDMNKRNKQMNKGSMKKTWYKH